MTGAAKAEYDEIAAFCEDFTEDLTKISVPVLVLHGEDDQIVNPAGMPTSQADVVNAGLLAFIRS